MADSPLTTSQNDGVLSERKNRQSGDRKNLDKERLANAASVTSRTKLAQLIQLASEAETECQTNYKKVVDTVFDSVRKYMYICIFI